jgi:cytosine/adenosine deaminase-related metal-dependent hydrolase
LVHLPKCNSVLLIHNTYSTSEDINWTQLYTQMSWWGFCPKANLFIDNSLPDFQAFIDSGCKIVVGTDSYASNDSLSILEELKTICTGITPHISGIKYIDMLLKWATLNGAELLGFKNELGSIEKGKTPGLNVITDMGKEPFMFTEYAMVKRIA